MPGIIINRRVVIFGNYRPEDLEGLTFHYWRPGGVDRYLRPSGGQYLRP